ncbi:uncharacterized protein LOC117110018 [Anneissia japonica]|uniref:uncharacterized protein LOC117110018 n=1 Tax=Anneissia japonica TaxID=1529436 RepID=UPI0014259DBE|nr:uncharacterized protein LOC117110018 [Anneissia japonica]
MRTITKVLQTASIEGKNVHQALYGFLRQYRATPHSTTAKSPAELLYGRKIKIRLPSVEIVKQESVADVRRKDNEQKKKMKERVDVHMHTKQSNLGIGDSVLVKQQKTNVLSTPFDIQSQVEKMKYSWSRKR